jgi:hypothetical protein
VPQAVASLRGAQQRSGFVLVLQHSDAPWLSPAPHTTPSPPAQSQLMVWPQLLVRTSQIEFALPLVGLLLSEPHVVETGSGAH